MRFLLMLGTAAGFDGQAMFAESMLIGTVINLLVVRWWLRGHPQPAGTAPAARGAPPLTAPASGSVMP
jgi:hypothetical protein